MWVSTSQELKHLPVTRKTHASCPRLGCWQKEIIVLAFPTNLLCIILPCERAEVRQASVSLGLSMLRAIASVILLLAVKYNKAIAHYSNAQERKIGDWWLLSLPAGDSSEVDRSLNFMPLKEMATHENCWNGTARIVKVGVANLLLY